MTGPCAPFDDAVQVPAISSPRSRASHYKLAAAIVASHVAAQAAEKVAGLLRGKLRRRMRRSAMREAQITMLVDAGEVQRIERAYRAMIDPSEMTATQAVRPSTTSLDPIVRALMGDAGVRRALGPVSATRTADARAWVDVERNHVTRKTTVRLTFRGAKENLADALAAARSAVVALGFRVVFSEIFRTPKMQAHTGTMRVEAAKKQARAL
ncbi:MAG: hypothetical protein EBZ50_04520 [Alphaproteobacteria bacterium]|nr:hypothetical protein [Alphaproteobacteria bacterium]